MFLDITISPITIEVISNLLDIVIKILAVLIVFYIISIYREVKQLYESIIDLEKSKNSFTINSRAVKNITIRSLGMYGKSDREKENELNQEKEMIEKDIENEINSIKLKIDSKLFLLKLYK